MGRERQRQRQRQRDRERQSDRAAERQTDRQTDRGFRERITKLDMGKGWSKSAICE